MVPWWVIPIAGWAASFATIILVAMRRGSKDYIRCPYCDQVFAGEEFIEAGDCDGTVGNH